MKKLLITLLSIIVCASVGATIKLPHLMSDGMVLQRDTIVNIWGKAIPGSHITVTPSWNNKKVTTTVSHDSTWIAKIPTPNAGGPYTLKISSGKECITLSDILIGEVWFCSGQSNMEMPMMGFYAQAINGTNEIIAKAKPTTPLRMFLADKRGDQWVDHHSATPQDDIWGRWYPNSPKHVKHASAVAYTFAKFVQEVLDIPVAIIVASKGGTRIEPYMSRESLAEFPEIDVDAILQPGHEINQFSDPTVHYNGTILPIHNYTIRGVIWYQGESNVPNANQYARMLQLFVENDLRGLWGNPEMPFYFVEIAPFDASGPDNDEWALLREAQLDAARVLPHSGIVSTVDIGNHQFIHPVEKITVGNRLALLALHDTYGLEGFGYASPRYESMEIKDNKVLITVSNAPDALCPMWTPLDGFEICGDDDVWHPAQAINDVSNGARLTVWSDQVPQPKAVRYAFRNYPTPSVFSISGLPLHPFRTHRQ